MSRIEKIRELFEEHGIDSEVIRVYTNLQGYNVDSFKDLDHYYDISSYDDELYDLLYEE